MEWMCELVGECVSEYAWMNKSASKHMNVRVNGYERVSKCEDEWLNVWVRE